MKKLFLGLITLMGLIGWGYAAEDKPAPPTMPSEVTLTSGRVLRGVSVIRWEPNRVVLRHTGGADPIAFSLVKSISAEDLAAMRDAGLAKKKSDEELARGEQKAKADAHFAELQRQDRFKRLIAESKIAVGMTKAQVLQSWGNPKRKNESMRGLDQWVYESNYVYFEGDAVVSWQSSS
jgi:hypothetical protein